MTTLINRRLIMTLYAEANDPIGHTVRIVLAEKDINVEINFVDQETKPEDLNDLNPYHGILTLIDRDLVLYDPQIMMEYLDERYPHPPLMPVDPVSRAQNRQLRFRVMKDLYDPFTALTSNIKSEVTEARKTINDNLLAIAPIFSRQPYFLSDEYSLVDCCIAPLLWRLSHHGITLSATAKPLVKYAEGLFAREAFRSGLSPVEREYNV